MSEVMTQAIIGMPYDMAMSDELSRRQFHDRAQYLLGEYEKLQAELAKLRAELERREVPDALLAEARMVISSMLDECDCDLPLELKWMAERASKGRRIYAYDRALAAAPSAPTDDPVKVKLIKALEAVLNSGRGTSGRIILDDQDEADVRAAIAAARKGEGG